MATSFKPSTKVTPLRRAIRPGKAKDRVGAGKRTIRPRRREGAGDIPASSVVINLAHEREVRKTRQQHQDRRTGVNWFQIAVIVFLIAIVMALSTWQ